MNHTISDQQLLVQVARLYYEHNLNQEEIAKRLNITRQKVSRLLIQARADGIVTISIHDPSLVEPSLAAELKSTFQLKEAVLTAGEGLDAEMLRRRIGMAAAEYVAQLFEDNVDVGVGWGRTLYEMVSVLPRSRQVRIRAVPMIGGIGDMAPFFQVNELARRMAEALGGTYRFFHVPAFIEDPNARAALMRTAEVNRVVELWQNLKYAVVGVGHVEFQQVSSMFFAGHISPLDLAQLQANGGVGDICARFYDVNGTPVEIGTGTIGIRLSELKAIPHVVAIAGGVEKVRALLGALRGGYIHTLVTDTVTAQAVLKESRGGR